MLDDFQLNDFRYHYPVTNHTVVDGDTLHATVDLGLGISASITIYLDGIDAIEKPIPLGDGDDPTPADALRLLLDKRSIVLTTNKDKREKYGRYLGTLHVKYPDANGQSVWQNVNEWMVLNGYATRRP